MGDWVVCVAPAEAGLLGKWIEARDGEARVLFETDPLRLRARLTGELGGRRVVVGEGLSGVSPVNLAAAVAADSTCVEVTLAVERPSGSLLSRAARAGVANVVSLEDVRALVSAQQASESAVSSLAGEGITAVRVEGEDEPAPVPPRSEGVPVVAFVSGRGGVGKTTLTALAGHVAAAWGLRVAMLDLDLAFGNLAALCGANEPRDLAALAESGLAPNALERCRTTVSEGIGVWGPCDRPEYAEVVYPLVEPLVSWLTQDSDLVLVDTSSSWGDATAQAAQLADRLVIVSDERPGAIPALARCGSLAVRLGVARTRIVRLMNGCDPRGRDESFVARAATGLECSRELKVMDGGAEAVELLSCGRAADLVALGGPLVESLSYGLAQLLQELGCLPDCEGAVSALDGAGRSRRRFSLLGRERP